MFQGLFIYIRRNLSIPIKDAFLLRTGGGGDVYVNINNLSMREDQDIESIKQAVMKGHTV